MANTAAFAKQLVESGKHDAPKPGAKARTMARIVEMRRLEGAEEAYEAFCTEELDRLIAERGAKGMFDASGEWVKLV
jgi:hypothetical protein